jgi:hypothetical protein
MTYAPTTIIALRDALIDWTGLGPVSLGIVGDAAHAIHPSYHNGRDRMVWGVENDYSARTDRDRAGLTNAASAIDIGTHRALRDLSAWLVREGRVNAPGTRDIREIIYTPDGQTVWRWDRERGYNSTPREGEADTSHLFHTHVSFYRDSEDRDKVALFKRFYEAGTEDNMINFTAPDTEVGGEITTIRDTLAIPITGGTRLPVHGGIMRPAIGVFGLNDLVDADTGTKPRLTYLMLIGPTLAFIAKHDVIFEDFVEVAQRLDTIKNKIAAFTADIADD